MKPEDIFYDTRVYDQATQLYYNGEYSGYPMIVSGMENIYGKVLYAPDEEALLVDPGLHPGIYTSYLQEADKRAKALSGDIPELDIIRAVYETVHARMAYSEEQSEAVCIREVGPDFEGKVIELGAFMEAGVGVCRHQSLTSMALLQAFKAGGFLESQLSIENLMRREAGSGKIIDGHTFLRITTPGGRAIIMDVANGVIETLDSCVERGKVDYMNDIEWVLYRARMLGRAAVEQHPM